LRRSLRDDPSPEDSASQARSSNRAPQVTGHADFATPFSTIPRLKF